MIHYTLVLAKGFIDRRTLIREKPGTILSYVQTVFQTNSKLAINHDRRFVAKAHSRLNRRFVAAYKVGPFVPIESDAVPGAMWEARHFVIRTKACVSDHLARGGIHCFARRAYFRRGKAGVL